MNEFEMINLANNAKTNWFCFIVYSFEKIQHAYLDFIFPPQYLTAAHKIVIFFYRLHK